MLARFSLLAAALVLATATFTSNAEASILFGPAVRYQTVKTTDQTSFAGGTGDSSALVGDAHLGVLVEGTPLYIGGIYSYESSTSGSNSTMTGANYGASVGYYSGAFSIIGSYLLDANRTYKTGSAESKLSKGTGFRVDLAYVAGLTGSIGIGPQLTYQSVKYSKSQASGGTESDNSFEVSGIQPGIVMWFRF